MLYKEGDEVKVRDDLVVNHCYQMIGEIGTNCKFTEEMFEFKGKVVTIVEIRNFKHTETKRYKIGELELYSWVDAMFENKMEGYEVEE